VVIGEIVTMRDKLLGERADAAKDPP